MAQQCKQKTYYLDDVPFTMTRYSPDHHSLTVCNFEVDIWAKEWRAFHVGDPISDKVVEWSYNVVYSNYKYIKDLKGLACFMKLYPDKTDMIDEIIKNIGGTNEMGKKPNAICLSKGGQYELLYSDADIKDSPAPAGFLLIETDSYIESKIKMFWWVFLFVDVIGFGVLNVCGTMWGLIMAIIFSPVIITLVVNCENDASKIRDIDRRKKFKRINICMTVLSIIGMYIATSISPDIVFKYVPFLKEVFNVITFILVLCILIFIGYAINTDGRRR